MTLDVAEAEALSPNKPNQTERWPQTSPGAGGGGAGRVRAVLAMWFPGPGPVDE